MPATNLQALLRVPGRLCLGPTSLSGGFPGNGTDLGLVADIVVVPNQRTARLREETLGVGTKHRLKLGEAWELRVAVRALEQGKGSNFFVAATGSETGEETIVSNPVENPPGPVISTVGILFWPFDELQNDFVWLPAAAPFVDGATAMAKTIRREGLFLAVFDATPRASDGLAAIHARKPDIEGELT